MIEYVLRFSEFAFGRSVTASREGEMRLLHRASEVLTRIMLGARVRRGVDGISQWNLILFCYAGNLLLVFVVAAGSAALAGFYQPLVAPLAAPALQILLAIANLVTFGLMCVASHSWEMNEASIGPQRAARRSKAEYWLLVLALLAASLFLAVLLFLSFNLAVQLASACVNAALLQFVWSRRFLNSLYRNENERTL